MRRVELLQNTVGALLHLGLGPPLGLVETLLPGAGPLALGQGEVLLAAVEPLRGVEEEVVLRDLGRDVQEGLQLGQLAPRLLDELVPVHDVDLVQGEVAHPPTHQTYDYIEQTDDYSEQAVEYEYCRKQGHFKTSHHFPQFSFQQSTTVFQGGKSTSVKESSKGRIYQELKSVSESADS